MQLTRVALLTAAAGSALGQGMTSICDKYTTALLKQNTGANQYTLLTLLVNTAVIGNYTGPGTMNSDLPGSMVAVPGILAPSGKIAKYFDGSLLSSNRNGKAASVNFLDGGGADPIIADPTSSGKAGSNQSNLLMHLYQFFGALLGCSEYGNMGFPSYAGDPNMAEVHQFMDIDETEFTYFVQQVGLAAASFGASKADIMTAANALNMTFGLRCSPPAAVLPDASKQPQAICIDDTCPLSPMMACGSYIEAVEPEPAMGGSGGATPAPTPAMSTPAAMTPAASMPAGGSMPATPIASQVTDGQPQVTSPGMPIYTGAAAPVAVPGALAGLVGFAAFLL